MKNYKTALKGIIGENLVTAELARRDIVATTFTGNIPDIDILAFKDYKTIPLQVKTLTKRSLHIADLTKKSFWHLFDNQPWTLRQLFPFGKNHFS